MERTRDIDVNIRAGAQMLEYVAIADRIASEIGGGAVLDWGCGFGQLTKLLRDRSVPTEAFDYRDGRPPGTERLERFPEIVAHVSGDPVRLPFDSDSFDAVLSCGVLEHVERPEESLEELRRVLRPGGRLYVYKLPNRFSYLEAIARRAGLYYHGRYPHDRIYTPRGARTLMERQGFQVSDVRLANMLPLSITHRFAQRLSAPIWAVNLALARVPGLRLLATNIEVDAVAR